MNDPLADLLAESEEAYEYYYRDTLDIPVMTLHEFASDRLRANRDRVLEALGGYSAADLTTDARARHQADRNTSVWLFPLGEDQ